MSIEYSSTIARMTRTAATQDEMVGLIKRLYEVGMEITTPANLVSIAKILVGDGGPNVEIASSIVANDVAVLQQLIDLAFGHKHMSPEELVKHKQTQTDKDLSTVKQNNLITDLFELPSTVHPSILAQGRLHETKKAQDLLRLADEDTKEKFARKSAWFALMARLPWRKLRDQWMELIAPLESNLRYDPENALMMPIVEKAIDETAEVIAPTFFGNDAQALGKAQTALREIFSQFYIDSFPGLSKADVAGGDGSGRVIDPLFYRSELDALGDSPNVDDGDEVPELDDDSAPGKRKKKPTRTPPTAPTPGQPHPQLTGPKVRNVWMDLYNRYDEHIPKSRNFEPLAREEGSSYMAKTKTGGVQEVTGGMILVNTSSSNGVSQGMVIGYKPEYDGRKIVVVRLATGSMADWDTRSKDVFVADTQVSSAARAEYKG